MRKDFNTKTKRAALDRCQDLCEICGRWLFNRGAHFHHRNGDNSDNSPENCEVLCVPCHVGITATVTIPANAKIKRVRDRRRGIRKRSRFPCSRSSPWRKKITGEVVPR